MIARLLARGACLRALITATLATLAVFAGADASALTDGGFGVRPAHFDPANPATRAYFIRSIKPRGTFSDQVIASNGSDSALRLRVYAVDGLTARTSGAVYANRSDRKFRAGTWVRPAVSLITLAPHGESVVGFTVRVPKGTPPGDHLAGIALETVRRPRSGARFSVVEVVREVVGVLVQVPGPARPRLAVGKTALRALPGLSRASAVVVIGNAGRKLCKPTLRVALSGPHGYRRAVSARLDTILPGDTIPYPLPWPSRLRPGHYSASSRAACPGTVASSRSSIRLGSALSGPTPHSPTSSHSSNSSTPVWVFLAVALGSAAVGASFSRRRHRRSSPPEASA
jgi:hypothetical protein